MEATGFHHPTRSYLCKPHACAVLRGLESPPYNKQTPAPPPPILHPLHTEKRTTMTMMKSTVAALIATLALSGAAHAAALDQFKSFVATTKSAKGEFTQQQQRKSASSKVAPVSSGSF